MMQKKKSIFAYENHTSDRHLATHAYEVNRFISWQSLRISMLQPSLWLHLTLWEHRRICSVFLSWLLNYKPTNISTRFILFYLFKTTLTKKHKTCIVSICRANKFHISKEKRASKIKQKV